MRHSLISFDLQADFGVFKKPDVNEGLQLTFNLLHKPALLGILGAIVGLEGYQRRGVFPQYYEKLHDLRVAIEPLGHEKGNFVKTVIQYTNTVGYANADGNLIVMEQTLRSPKYRIYLRLDLDIPVEAKLYDHICAGEAEYLPYFGKNECSAAWEKESVKMYQFEQFTPTDDFQIASAFIRDESRSMRSQKAQPRVSPSTRSVLNAASFIYFERIPIDFFVGDRLSDQKKSLNFVQYDLAEFVYMDWVLQKDSVIRDLYSVQTLGEAVKIIQLV